MNTITYILIGFSVLLMIIIILVRYYLNNNDKYLSKKILKNKTNNNKLVEISYSNSGDNKGNVDYLIIDLLNEKMITKYRDSSLEPLLIIEYKISKDINKIVDKIKKYNLPAYKNIPVDPLLINLDKAIESLTLVYEDSKKEYITIDLNMRIPKTARMRLLEVINDIKELKDNSEVIRKREEK